MSLAAVAVPFGVLHHLNGSLIGAPRSLQVSAAGASLSLLVAAVAIMVRPRMGRCFATLAVLATDGIALPQLAVSPSAALAVLVATTLSLVLLWKTGVPAPDVSRTRHSVVEGQAHGASIVAFTLWFLWLFGDAHRPLTDTLIVAWPICVSCLLSLEWTVRNFRSQRFRSSVLLLVTGTAIALMPMLWREPWWAMSSFVGSVCTAMFLLRPTPRLEMDHASWWEPLLGHPERLLVGTFAALCFGGTVLLALPQSATSGKSVDFVDAAFTATSAVCVTGLAVLDTPIDFTALGQLVILLLIQIGGLGIMTFSTVALWALGRRMSLQHEGAVASLISTQDRGRLFSTAKRILQLTLTAEGIGAVVLAFGFSQMGDKLPIAIWRGLFTSISAFCNAGFALQSDNLISYQRSPLILHTVGVLILLGGLSPVVVFALPAIVRRSAEPVLAQARLALAATVALLAGGFFFILAFEWNDSLKELQLVNKLHNAWFQSVTLRTAGFNSIDLTVIHPATLTLMLLWMFIGGNPGGTAGGVKTTTLAVLVLSVVGAIRGQWTLEVFGKRVPEHTRARAIVVVAVAATVSIVALVSIQLTQDMSTRLAVFEVVSALGTVGLSIGGTAQLDGIGKAIIAVCMFIGRIGGLTLLMFLSNRRAPATLGRPEEEISVG